MAWTTPMTFTAGAVLTAAQLNTHLRDNLLETSAATATTAGSLVYADAANSMGSELTIGAVGSHLVSTGSAPIWRLGAADFDGVAVTTGVTSYAGNGDPWQKENGNPVEVTLTTGTHVLILWKCVMANSSAGAVTFVSPAISGATTSAAVDNRAIRFESSAANDTAELSGWHWSTGLTGGSNTFTLDAKVSAGTATLDEARLLVIPFS